MKSGFRSKRFKNFVSTLDIQEHQTILDVGGYPFTWETSGLKNNITILNLDLSHHVEYKDKYSLIEGDACNMSHFSDRQFDIVFSNSVIEHVGTLEQQRQMASEIQRVGKAFWIQTPYKHFPIEIHFLFPFYQYLPTWMRHPIAKVWPFSFPKRLKIDPIVESDHIWLLNIKEFKSLFKQGILIKERYAGFIKSLVMYQKSSL